MNKKLLFGMSLAILVIFALGSVSAFDWEIFGGKNIVTIEGVDFKIPDGFNEDADKGFTNESNVQEGVTYFTSTKVFEKDGTIMTILVADYDDYPVTDDIAKEAGGNATTIKGVNGYLTEDGFFYIFNYATDGKLVVLSTNDKNVIGDFIVA